MYQDIKDRALQLLKKLGEAHGAPGYEDAVRAIFRQELGSGVSADRFGNMVYELKGRSASPRIMLSAHMDEIGFAVHSITHSGLIRFATLGGWWAHTLLSQRVRILTRAGREVIGVIGAKPPHFLERKELEKVLETDKMFIDIGAKDANEAKSVFGVEVGDPIVPDSSFLQLANPDIIMCKAFDNRVGMALMIQVVLQLAKEAGDHPNTVYAVGTVQEELGMRGAQTAAFNVNPDVAVVLEGAPADDHPDIKVDERQGVLAGGVQVRILDPSAVMNRQFVDHAVRLAKREAIPFQLAVRKSGATDARVIHLHGGGVPTIVLGVPARYIHTQNTLIHLDDYVSALRLILAIVRTVGEKQWRSFTTYQY